MPAGTESKWSEAHQRLEERALDMKIRKLDGHSLQQTNAKSREQWMLELPEAKAKYLGLEARTFRAKEGPDMSDRYTRFPIIEIHIHKIKSLYFFSFAQVKLDRHARRQSAQGGGHCEGRGPRFSSAAGGQSASH